MGIIFLEHNLAISINTVLKTRIHFEQVMSLLGIYPMNIHGIFNKTYVQEWPTKHY